MMKTNAIFIQITPLSSQSQGREGIELHPWFKSSLPFSQFLQDGHKTTEGTE